MLSFPSDRRLLMQIVGGDRRPDVATRNRQAAQGTTFSAARRPRAVVPSVQQLRQQMQRPQPHSWQGRCAAACSSPGSDGTCGSSRNDELEDCQGEFAASSTRHWRGGNRPSEAPDYDAAQLSLSLRLPSSAVKQGMDKLPSGIRQHGMVQHGSEVAAHLRSLGVRQQQLGQLVVRCPVLFSWPAEERAAVLFGQLQQLGLTATEAGKCFQTQTRAADSPTFQPAIDVLAALYEAAGGKSGEQLLGRLLRGQPAAVNLLKYTSDTLRKRIVNLRRLTLSSAQIVAGLRQSWMLLLQSPNNQAKQQQVLHDELGVGPKLFAKILCFAPRVVNSSEETLVSRCRALVAVFGKEAALEMVDACPGLLKIGSHVWQVALEVMRLVGVTDPAAVAQRNSRMLEINWLDPRRLVNRLALQRCLGLTPAAAYQQYAGHVSGYNPQRLAGRLLYLEQCGLLPLVEDKRARLQAWRREHGLPPGGTAPGKPAFVSFGDVGSLTDAKFLSLLSKNGCGSNFAAFQAGLESLPDYQQLWAAAEVEGARLRAALPDELRGRLAAAADEEAAEEGEE